MTDSEDVARNLDLAAHHTWIESGDFQDEWIPRQADIHAMRLYDTVKPLFGLQNSLDLWEADILQEWQRHRSTLKKIFVSALRVKTKALVSRAVFEVIFPMPGLAFDQDHTEVERLEQECPGLAKSPIVRLCLVPGLKRFSCDRKLVDYNSFRKPTPSSAETGDDISSPLIIPAN